MSVLSYIGLKQIWEKPKWMDIRKKTWVPFWSLKKMQFLLYPVNSSAETSKQKSLPKTKVQSPKFFFQLPSTPLFIQLIHFQINHFGTKDNKKGRGIYISSRRIGKHNYIIGRPTFNLSLWFGTLKNLMEKQ